MKKIYLLLIVLYSSIIYSQTKGITYQAVTGVVVEPYRGAKKNGFKGGAYGIVKGVGGLVARPIKGGFDLVS